MYIVQYFFLNFITKTCPWRGRSSEYLQYMFWIENIKNRDPPVLLDKSGVSGVFFSWTCFPVVKCQVCDCIGRVGLFVTQFDNVDGILK